MAAIQSYAVHRLPESGDAGAGCHGAEYGIDGWPQMGLLGYRILLGILAGLAFILTTAISLCCISLSKLSAQYEFAGTIVIWGIAGFLFAFYSAFMANFYVAVSGDTGIDPEPGPAVLTEPEPEDNPAA